MFYDNHKICFEITNVFHVTREKAKSFNKNRAHSGIAYRISGSTQFFSKGKTYIADTKSISFVPAYVDYERHSTEEELIIIHLNCYGENENEIEIVPPHLGEKLSAYFFKIAEEWEKGAPGYKHRCTSLFYKMLEDAEQYKHQNPANAIEEQIKNSVIYMNMNFDSPFLSIGEIAEKSHISQVYFRKLYKDLYGISPIRAIMKLRIDKAKALLDSGYFSVKKIAGKCGFENEKYFSTLFKRETGFTPAQYRKLT